MHHDKTPPAPESPVARSSQASADPPEKSLSPEQLLPTYVRDIARDASDSADDFVEKFHTHQQGE